MTITKGRMPKNLFVGIKDGAMYVPVVADIEKTTEYIRAEISRAEFMRMFMAEVHELNFKNLTKDDDTFTAAIKDTIHKYLYGAESLATKKMTGNETLALTEGASYGNESR